MFLAPVQFLKSPEARERTWGPSESLEYTRWLATHHYENFQVVSFLLPKRLHQDFYNVYSFCRWADDLGDEIGDAAESLRLLAWWRAELHAMYAGETRHPVFVALRDTAARHELPIEPFDDLITAFEQDQTVTRYRDFENFSNIADIPRIPWDGWCWGYADIAMPSVTSYPMRPAPRYSSRISGRT